ncbi:MAG: WD40/YVTN/BNR-like repeat-containing protein [Gemmatimonadota bacterium]
MRRSLRLTAPVLVGVLATACASAGAHPAGLAAQEHRAPTAVTVDTVFHSLDARPIGPPGTSGRVAALAVSPRDEREIWVGAATGGVWKSVDGGFTWTPVMDSVPVGSIGAIGIAPTAPDVVYVGTGESSVRNSMGVGRGVWKSRDGGRTWTHLGLERTERIQAIVVHPSDPDVVWLTALGPAWSDGTERGVFKSTDGGATWRKVLYVDERTGAFQLVMDPSNPEHLLASTWEYRRWPWFFESGGPGSGLWQSWDGGESWDRLTADDGLPQGELGRIGLGWATNDPTVVYALVEAERSALLRSDDGGSSWRAVNTDRDVNERPFYYSRVRVDPTNENRVYRVSGDLTMSEDGGRTFRNIAPWSSVHVDHHAFVALPDGHTIITGNDGGVYFSHTRGDSWRFVENLPLAQFYHLSVDDRVPFNVYGGLQDNGSWMGPSQVWETPSFAGANIVAHHWEELGFGDGFAALIDPSDPTLGYAMSQGGSLMRFDLATSGSQGIRPPAPDSATELRFNWNAGIAIDPFDPTVVYYGSQFVHRTADRGETWEIISPDLTTDDPEKQRQAESGGLTLDVTAAENHTTILTIAPSPAERGVLWVGTDDGNVQVTRDGGASWTNVVDRVPGVPDHTWVPHIEASRHVAGRAYVVFDGHRSGDWETYVFRTDDYGRSWRALAPDQVDGYVHVIEEDPVEPNLLFLGSEFGLYFSLDGGDSWRKWTHGGYPAGVPTRALVVHPRDADLAIGTHGRGAWIIDDIRPLREMAAGARRTDGADGARAADATPAGKPAHFFEVPDAVQHERGVTGPFYFPGDTKYQGPNRPYGALISYWVAPATAEAASGPGAIEILQADTVVRTLKAPVEAGVNRIVWGLERKGLPDPDADEDDPEPSGPEVFPGTYDVRLTIGDHTAGATVRVLPDPRREKSLAVLQENLAQYWRGQEGLRSVQSAIRRLNETNEILDLYEERLEDWDDADEATRDSLLERTDELKTRLGQFLDRLRMPAGKGIREDTTVTAELRGAIGQATGTPYQPSPARVAQLEWALAALDSLLAEIERVYAAEVPEYRDALRQAGFELLK